jgi:hypothetical protein
MPRLSKPGSSGVSWPLALLSGREGVSTLGIIPIL